jgi:hypothetical protein
MPYVMIGLGALLLIIAVIIVIVCRSNRRKTTSGANGECMYIEYSIGLSVCSQNAREGSIP